MTRLTESTVESAALGWLEAVGWRITHGQDIAPDTLGAERTDYGEVVLAQRAPSEARLEEEIDHAVRQIISRAVTPEGVVDIFAAAGLEKPDLSILSDEFLAEVRGMPQKNLAVELLQKLLKGELANRRRKNVVQARSFADMLEQTIRKYQSRAVEAAQVIEELIQLARDMREANARGEQLGLTEDEVAFYDALETNDSAVKVLGDATLRGLARAVGRDGEEKPKSPRKTWRESILGRGTCDALATFWTQAAAAAPPPPAPSLASRPSGFSSSTEYGKGGRGRRPSRRTLRVGSRESRHDPPLRSSMDDEEGGSPKIELIRGLGFAIDMEFTRTHTLLVNKTFLSPRQMPTSWGED